MATPSPKASSSDDRTLRAAMEALTGGGERGMVARLLPFLGPAFIASVAYVDPGNFATNIQAGSQLGYTLLWVIVASNLMAMLLQGLSAKLGIATGKNLAEHCRLHFRRPIVLVMWVVLEIVAMATDLAEFLGAALGFNLLLGVPLFVGGILTAIATVLILGLERHGFRLIEAVITVMVGIIAACYVVQTILDRPAWGDVLFHSVVPQFKGSEGVLLATGILGATVMPHAVYLHSALTQGRIVVREPERLRRLFRFEIVDVITAMGIASLVNAAILVMAAATFFHTGMTSIGSIEEAHRTLEPLLGSASSWVFALSLLASGLSSATVGTSAGQIIMQGFIHRQVPVWIRRMVTMAPSLVVIALGLDPTRTMVISQVILSFGLPLAIVPLVLFTRRKDLMGVLVNHRITTVLAGIIAAVVLALNAYLLWVTLVTS